MKGFLDIFQKKDKTRSRSRIEEEFKKFTNAFHTDPD